MNRDLKLKFDEMQENKPAGASGASDEDSYEKFDAPGNVRNLCFVWPDGRKKFLNYAYLVSGEYDPDQGSIRLVFTTDIVVIKGSGLDGFFNELLGHFLMSVRCIDPRYNLTSNGEFAVNEIIFENR